MKPVNLARDLRTMGLSAAQFAAEIGVNRSTVVRWLGGKARIPLIVALYLDFRMSDHLHHERVSRGT